MLLEGKARIQAVNIHESMSSTLSALGILCSAGLAASASTAGLKWVQICVEGTFLGHPKFPRIDWTSTVFQTIVGNLHKHPSYRKGPDGVGCARVIPWDYEHANEIARVEGRIPSGGLPSESWTYDLQVRRGTDGKAQLWALTEWLPNARELILSGRYQGCSVCVAPTFIDPVSGKDQGPTLTSIALTNDPFVQGMEPIAATLRQAKEPAAPSLDENVAELVRRVNGAQGRNAIERMNAVMLDLSPTHSGLTLDQQVRAASDAISSLMAGKYPAGVPVVTPEPATTVQSIVAAYNSAPGRNPVEKANHVLCVRVASHKSLAYAEQCRRAGDFVRALLRGEMPEVL